MDLSVFLLYAVIFGMGVLVGINMRNSFAEEKESRTFSQISEEVRHRLQVAEELNRSLLSDLAFAKKKLAAMNRSAPGEVTAVHSTNLVQPLDQPA
jgi:hypothetical protein